jgi:hypothetical protein
VDGGLLTGFGEDLRAVVRKRMADLKAGGKHSHRPWFWFWALRYALCSMRYAILLRGVQL